MNRVQILVIGLGVVLCVGNAESQQGKGARMNPQQELLDANIVKALEIGLKKARELGYDIEKMKVTLSVSDGACIVYFEILVPPGQGMLGGDLTVTIDLKSQRVIKFERGQ